MTVYAVTERGIPTTQRGLRFRTAVFNADVPLFIAAGSSGATFHWPGYTRADALRDEFIQLADRWHDETGHLSSPMQIAMHDAYQRIIGIGDRVIPYILRDLSNRGGQWYWALHALTGASPVPNDALGDVPRMKGAWLRWGRQHGYLLD